MSTPSVTKSADLSFSEKEALAILVKNYPLWARPSTVSCYTHVHRGSAERLVQLGLARYDVNNGNERFFAAVI